MWGWWWWVVMVWLGMAAVCLLGLGVLLWDDARHRDAETPETPTREEIQARSVTSYHPLDLVPDRRGSMDITGLPTHECPVCESNMWRIVAVFDDYEIALYFTKMECVFCGTRATAPTLADKEARESSE